MSLDQVIAEWGYGAIFVVVVLGNVGLPIPEETILILAGYFVWEGELRLPAVLLVGILSAAAGDNLGYWLGRVYGRPAIDRHAHWVLVTPAQVEAMTRFVARYGVVGVVAARFVPGLRFLGGPLAGAARMRFLRFFAANLLGAACFVPYSVGLGYAIGYGLGEYVERVRRVTGINNAT